MVQFVFVQMNVSDPEASFSDATELIFSPSDLSKLLLAAFQDIFFVSNKRVMFRFK